MAYLIVFVGLLMAELIYFRIANRFNIIDKPNLRSSHSNIVLRGGGIIFTISLLLYFFTHQFNYPWFMLGLVTIAGISFVDDVRHQSRKLRMLLQVISIALLLYQLYAMELYSFNWLLLNASVIAVITSFIAIVFLINAYNFMDGINGLTTGYSFTVLAALFYLNIQLKIFDQEAIIYLALANLVFFIFNFMTKAKCFAGDVGSVGMAFALLFFLIGFALKTNSPIFLLLFAIYGVDAGITIFQRLLKKENILEAHRQHLYQYLANEKQCPQLLVSLVYIVLQSVISLCVCLFWQKSWLFQRMFILIVLGCLTTFYILVKRSISKASNI